MRDPLKYGSRPRFQNSSLVVGWDGDAGRLGGAVTDFIIRKLEGQVFYDIDPEDYFPLGSVSIEDDLVQFPESKLYVCPDYNLVVLKSTPPSFEFYKFFNQILDIAENYCQTKQIYTLGSMVSLASHTTPRQILGTFTSDEFKEALDSCDIENNSDYETPPGQKPTLNSFLLWAIKKRNLEGVGLWVPVPFYLMSVDDPKSQRKVLEFFNQRFQFEFDLSELDETIKKQDQKIEAIRKLNPEVDTYFLRLESNLTLSEEENMKLVNQIGEYLKGT